MAIKCFEVLYPAFKGNKNFLAIRLAVLEFEMSE